MNRVSRNFIVSVMLACAFMLTLGYTSHAAPAAQGKRFVTDMTGTKVELPKKVTRVIDLWHANNQVVLLLGGADKLIGTTNIVKDLPWYSYVYPRIKDVPAFTLQSAGGKFNIEEILSANPDVVIVSSAREAEVLRNAGTTAAVVTFRDFKGLKETVRVTAQVLGDDAPQRAEEFCKYLDGNLKMLRERLGGLNKAQKPKVYQIRSDNPLTTDGKVSICTQWIEAAGGINVDANMTEVVLEEILTANPEVIIVATRNAGPVIKRIKTDPAWSSIKAVKEGRIYANPVGTFLWSRYSCEEALQVLWAAKILHPQKFKDIDMPKKVQDFYKKFYGFDMSRKTAERMLQQELPPQ